MNIMLTSKLVDLDCVEKCPKHTQNIIIYFCNTHDEVGCHECMSTTHSACAKNNIADIAEGTKDSVSYETLLEELHSIKRHTEKNETKAEENKLKSGICLSTALLDIRTFRQDINTHLDQMEEEIAGEAKQINLNYRLLMNGIIEESQALRGKVEHLLKEVKEAEAKETKLFIKLKQRNADVMKYKHETERNRGLEETKTFVFEPNRKLVDIFRTSNNFGKLIVERTGNVKVAGGDMNGKADDKVKDLHDGVDARSVKNEQNRTDVGETNDTTSKQLDTIEFVCDNPEGNSVEDLHGIEYIDNGAEETKPPARIKINAKLLSDKQDCDISGMDMLSEDEIVLADYNNRSVKIIDLNDNTIRDELKLKFHPYDLTVPKENTIVVTLTNTIQVIKKSHILRLEDSIQFDGECYGIASNQNKLFVSFVKPSPKIEVLNLQGDVLQTIDMRMGGRDIFKRPRYVAVCPNEKFVYVTDFETDSIVLLSLAGEKSKVFRDTTVLNGPYGIHVGVDGHVLVCNYGNDNIYEFSADLSKHRSILTKKEGIESPQSIYICDKQNKLFIACTDNLDCNEIQIFNHRPDWD